MVGDEPLFGAIKFCADVRDEGVTNLSSVRVLVVDVRGIVQIRVGGHVHRAVVGEPRSKGHLQRRQPIRTEDGRSLQTLQAYRYDAAKLAKIIVGVRVGEATPARIDAALRSMRDAHSTVVARRSRTLLRGGLQLAVMANVLGSNPTRDASVIRSNDQPKGAVALTADQLRELLAKMRASDYCHDHDLVDPITMLIATGLRRSELLGLRWSDFDETAGTLTITGKVVRVVGKGLLRLEQTKTAARRRTLPLPTFAIDMLRARRTLPYLGEQKMIFPSTAGTLRDPDNFAKLWRTAREQLGVPDVRTHTFRKTVATLIDDEGLSARIGADHLGHAKISMTQDVHMARGRMHTQVAELLDRTVQQTTPVISDE